MTERLLTVADYIKDARVLLLDTVAPYRYQPMELLVAFNTALLEARRLRADLFVHKWGNRVPQYDQINNDAVPIEPQFRLAFVYGTVGMAIARDDEDVQDERANSFLGYMHDVLTGVRPRSIQAGTPGPNGQR